MKNRVLWIVFLSCFSQAYAEVPRSSVALGSGGGGAASVEAGEASFMNPASIAHLRGRHFFSSFQKDLWALSLVQNDRQSAVPGALSYFKDKDNERFSLGLADFVMRKVSFGASVDFWQSQLRSSNDKRSTAFNSTVGVTWTPTANLGLAAVASNIVDRPDSFKNQSELEPSTRVGLNYVYNDYFRMRLDFVTLENNSWKNWTPQAGLESYLNQWLIIRTGVSRPPGLKESWSAGLGLDLPRFRLDYASQWHVNGGKEQRHSVDLGIPF